MSSSRYGRLVGVVIAAMFVISACGDDSETTPGDATPDVGDTISGEDTSTSAAPDGDPSDSPEETVAPAGDTGGSGSGVILADLCAGGQPLNGAISLDDLVTFGLLSSTDATVEGSGAYSATAYETFGFLCNISEAVGDGENFVTIGVSEGSDTWDLALDQGDSPVEQIGDWEVIIGSSWLSPLTMRATEADGRQHSLFAVWTPADGSIPDAETLERLMRPLAEAIATKSTLDIPKS